MKFQSFSFFKLNDLKAVLADANKAVEDAKAKLADAKKAVSAAKAKHQGLANAKENLIAAQAAYDKALADKADVDKVLVDETAKLEDLKVVADKAHQTYVDLLACYHAQLEAEHQAHLLDQQAQIIAQGQTPMVIRNEAGQVIGYTAGDSLTVQVQAVTYSGTQGFGATRDSRATSQVQTMTYQGQARSASSASGVAKTAPHTAVATSKQPLTTGDHSRVARQMALGGYGILAGLSLFGLKKRKRG